MGNGCASRTRKYAEIRRGRVELARGNLEKDKQPVSDKWVDEVHRGRLGNLVNGISESFSSFRLILVTRGWCLFR